MQQNGTPALTIDAALARRLVDTQFPQWTGLPIRPVEQGGWDNRTFHLGDKMTVRLPSAAWYALQVEKEQKWLPRLAPQLPVPIPAPLAEGKPDQTYPWPWSIYGWIDGETAKDERIGDMNELALDVANFLNALQQADATGGPLPGMHNFHRGGPPAYYDADTWRALDELKGKVDTDLCVEVWRAALAATWQGDPVWFHGDIAWGNLLVRDGKLAAVIDFGTSGIGDPACDLAIAWTLFKGESRETFRAARGLDPATWARGRGWTLWKALIVIAGHAGAVPSEREKAWRVLDEVLADHKAAA